MDLSKLACEHPLMTLLRVPKRCAQGGTSAFSGASNLVDPLDPSTAVCDPPFPINSPF